MQVGKAVKTKKIYVFRRIHICFPVMILLLTNGWFKPTINDSSWYMSIFTHTKSECGYDSPYSSVKVLLKSWCTITSALHKISLELKIKILEWHQGRSLFAFTWRQLWNKFHRCQSVINALMLEKKKKSVMEKFIFCAVIMTLLLLFYIII